MPLGHGKGTMDEKKRKILLLAGGGIALLILGIVLFALMGGEEAPTAPPPVAESEASPEESAPAPAAAEKVTSLKAPGRTTLEALAARPEVYGDGSKWWALFKANPQAVRYLFQNAAGNWVALVPPGAEIGVPAVPAAVLAGEQAQLRKGFGAYAVQFASYQNVAEADALLSRLAQGEPSADFYATDARVDGQDYRRVRAGLFSRWGDAEDYGKAVNSKYGEVSDYYVIRVSGREVQDRNQSLETLYSKAK